MGKDSSIKSGALILKMETTFDILKKMVLELFANDHSRIHSRGVTIEDLTMVLLLILVPKQDSR